MQEFDTDYCLGVAANKMIPLRLLLVPDPDQVIYKPAAMFYQRADFHRVGDGFASIEWIYDILDNVSTYKLLEFLNGEESKGIYVRSDIRDGTYLNNGQAFNVFYAVMWKPILTGEEGVSVARSSKAQQTVKITFMNPIIQAGYL